MQKMMGLLRRCVEDYDMIADGDKIAVGVSGGKDSLVLLKLMAALRQTGVQLPFDHLVEAVICCLVAATVSVILCIHREAWLSLREKPKTVVWMLLVALVCNALMAWINWNEMWTDGVLNFRSTNLFVTVFMLVILLVFGIKRLCVYLREIHDGLAERD